MQQLVPTGQGVPTGWGTDADLESLYLPPAGRHVRAYQLVGLDGPGRAEEAGGGRVLAALRGFADVVVVGADPAPDADFGPVPVVVCGDERVDDAAFVEALAGRGLTRVLCEGEPALVARWLDAGLVDDLCVTLAPVVAGTGHGVAALTAGGVVPATPDGHTHRLALAHLLEADGLLLARYTVERGAS